MNAKPTSAHLAVLVAHTIATLPDSFRTRKTVLVTLDALLPRDSDLRPQLIKLIDAMRTHEAAQLKFSNLDGHGDGDGHHNS